MSAKQEYSTEEKNFLPATAPAPWTQFQKLKNKNFVMWIGHNSFWVRLHQHDYITDPIFSQRALLPKRLTAPGITLNDFLKYQPEGSRSLTIILTHNHYDHLDRDTIKKLPLDRFWILQLGEIRELLL